jgi:hypothetical protein
MGVQFNIQRGSVLNKGVNIPWIKIYTGVNLPRLSTYYMTPGANPAVLVTGLYELLGNPTT